MIELRRFFFQFWNSFATAYQESNIPANTVFPYIAYQFARPEWGMTTIINANIYDRSTSFNGISAIGAMIEEAIPGTGSIHVLENNKGVVIFRRGNPFISGRSLPEEEISQNIKADYVNVEMTGYLI